MPRLSTLLRPLSFLLGNRPANAGEGIERRDSFQCPYCFRVLQTEAGRQRHISLRWNCRKAHERQKTPGLASAKWDDINLEALDLWETGAATDEADVPTAQFTFHPTKVVDVSCVAEEDANPANAPSPPGEPDLSITPELVLNPSDNKLTFDEREQVFVERFPDPRAGAPINDKIICRPDPEVFLAAAGNLGNPWHFDTAKMLMTTGLTAGGRDEHLQCHIYAGNTPWKNNKDLMDDIDALPHGPGWKLYKMTNKNDLGLAKTSYLFTRDIVEVIKDIMANPAFKEHMRYAPERHYRDRNCRNRVYGNPCTGNWWWRTQLRIPDKWATLIPVFMASDRTRLSMVSGGQGAYAVYLTVGCIDKVIRRKTTSNATVLLAYLPVDDFEDARDAADKARMKNQLTHQAMEIVTEPLRKASKEGIELVCADGRIRRGYPIFAGSIGDWPEQCMMACVEESRCPRCMQTAKGRGNYPMRAAPRSSVQTLEALDQYFIHDDLGELDELGLRPWWPWWHNLPYVEFHRTLMPDVLHQLYQGMIKTHAVRWTQALVGKRRVDLYFMSMPGAEGMRHLKKGISKLKGQWTGRESREVAKQLLPVAASQPSSKLDPDFIGLIRSILDFSYRTHTSRMSEEDIARLVEALGEMHHFKNVLIRLEHFQDDSRFDAISKLHMLAHYAETIREMGTPDNYSTEAPEHLHIECAKKGWRASNKVRPTEQMARFMERYEALRIFRAYMDNWLGIVRTGRRKSRVVFDEDDEVDEDVEDAEGAEISGRGEGQSATGARDGETEACEREHKEDKQTRREREEEEAEGPHVDLVNEAVETPDEDEGIVYLRPRVSIPLRPTAGNVKGLDLVSRYGATHFIQALHVFLNKHKPREHLPAFFFPTIYHLFPVWHRIYLHHAPLPFDPEHHRRDVIRARPQTTYLDATFDVAMLKHRDDKFGLHRYRAGRVRAVFSLPKGLEWLYSGHLVYVELFNPFSTSFTPFHRLNTTSQALNSDGTRCVAVVPIHDVVAACHLAPQIRRLDPETSLRARPDLLTDCRHFFHNHYYNHFIFGLIEHWRAARAPGQTGVRSPVGSSC